MAQQKVCKQDLIDQAVGKYKLNTMKPRAVEKGGGAGKLKKNCKIFTWEEHVRL